MSHEIGRIATIAVGFGLAMVLGYVAVRLAQQLAEIGVMLLMFGVGLHFSLGDLLSVKRIAVPGAIVQIGVATLLGAGTATPWGWDAGGALVFALCLSVASTVVLLRALEAKGILDSVNGQIAVGWLVVEDLVMVLVLVLLPALAGLLGTPSVAHPAVASGGGSCRACSGGWPGPDRGSSSPARSRPWRWAWPSGRPGSSTCPSRWGRSSRA